MRESETGPTVAHKVRLRVECLPASRSCKGRSRTRDGTPTIDTEWLCREAYRSDVTVAQGASRVEDE